jgi:hypothetical protein
MSYALELPVFIEFSSLTFRVILVNILNCEFKKRGFELKRYNQMELWMKLLNKNLLRIWIIDYTEYAD